jgi:hypothetical protein
MSLALLGLALACKPLGKKGTEKPSAEPVTTNVSGTSVETFGAKLGDSPEVTLAQVLQTPAEYAGKSVRLEGHVRRACSAKGCWMEVAPSADPGVPGCRVTFKDYGFFVPTDSAGARARVEGEVTLKRVRPAHVRHYEGEGASFASKHEDGSADEVRLVATGVELRR